MLAGTLPVDKFVVGDMRDVSPVVQACCVMAGPTDLTNEKFVENLRKTKEQSNSFQWFGKLYDSDPELYREASPVTHFTKETGPVLFLTGDLDNPSETPRGWTS